MPLFLTNALPLLGHDHASAAAFLTCRHHNFHSSMIPEFLSDEEGVELDDVGAEAEGALIRAAKGVVGDALAFAFAFGGGALAPVVLAVGTFLSPLCPTGAAG